MIDDQLKIDAVQQLSSLITDFTLLISDVHRKQLERRKKSYSMEKNRKQKQNKY